MNWHEGQRQIDNCRRCEQDGTRYLVVPDGPKRRPPSIPPQPTQLLFISVAPPWDGSYFWDETKPDKLREGLFSALKKATKVAFSSVQQFWEAGYFLVPGVKCSSQHAKRDHRPAAGAIKNCASHLKREIAICGPERILALGRDPVQSIAAAFNFRIPKKVIDYRRKLWWAEISGRSVPVAGTYFAGNDRHQGSERIVEDIVWILTQRPLIIGKDSQSDS